MEQWNKGKKTTCEPYKQRVCDCSTKWNNDGTKGTKHGTRILLTPVNNFAHLQHHHLHQGTITKRVKKNPDRSQGSSDYLLTTVNKSFAILINATASNSQFSDFSTALISFVISSLHFTLSERGSLSALAFGKA